VLPELVPEVPLLALAFDADVPTTPAIDELDPGFRTQRLHGAIGQFLERVLVTPTLLVVEDVHWLDDASRELLADLVATPRRRPWLICATLRPDVDGIVASGRADGLELRLEPLSPADSSALVREAARAAPLAEHSVEAIAERSAGNPLFVRELVASALQGQAVSRLPENVEALITARLDRLDPADQVLLSYASVVGTRFEPALLAAVVG